jgi:hypothetical protein
VSGYLRLGKGLNDQWVVVIEGFAPPRKQAHAAIRFDRDSAIAVEFDFLCGVRGYVAVRIPF